MQASLTVRTNEEFDSCRVRKGTDDIVSISDRDRGQQVRLETFLVYLGNGSFNSPQEKSGLVQRGGGRGS